VFGERFEFSKTLQQYPLGLRRMVKKHLHDFIANLRTLGPVDPASAVPNASIQVPIIILWLIVHIDYNCTPLCLIYNRLFVSLVWGLRRKLEL
jgi:hypothetical protein